MKCSICGGEVIWWGEITNLTHTECLKCGAINSQEIIQNDDFDERDLDDGNWIHDPDMGDQ